MRSLFPLLPLFALPILASAPALASETVPVAAFQSIELRGGGELTLRRAPVQRVTLIEGSSQFTTIRVVSRGRLKIDACNNRCPQHYRLRILVESPTVPTLAIEGGGKISTADRFAPQRELTVAVHGGGAIDARGVAASKVTAAVQGGGDIRVHADRDLTAAVMGGGAIRYSGNPAVTSAIQGGGSVNRIR